MIIYLFLVFLVLFFYKQINTKKYNIFDFILNALLVGVCGLRYKVGSDYALYVDMYKGVYIERVEILDKLLIETLNKFHCSSEFFLFFMALVTISVFYISIKKNSKNPAFSILLFITLGYYAMCFNGVRQMLAASICLFATKYLIEENFKKYTILIIFASLFHTTSLILLPIYFFRKCDFSKKTCYILFFIFALSFILYFPLENFITTNIARYSVYSVKNSYTFWEPGIGTFINSSINLFIIFLCIKNKEKLEKINSNNKIYLYIILISTIFYSLSYVNALTIRLTYYFSIYMIFLLPDLFDSIIKNRREKNYLVILIILVLYFIVHLLSFNDMIPYQSIIQ